MFKYLCLNSFIKHFLFDDGINHTLFLVSLPRLSLNIMINWHILAAVDYNCHCNYRGQPDVGATHQLVLQVRINPERHQAISKIWRLRYNKRKKRQFLKETISILQSQTYSLFLHCFLRCVEVRALCKLSASPHETKNSNLVFLYRLSEMIFLGRFSLIYLVKRTFNGFNRLKTIVKFFAK